MTTNDLLEVGGLLLLFVPGFAGVGHVLGGFIAMAFGKDEELWMRRGEIVVGTIGFGAWLGAALGILVLE